MRISVMSDWHWLILRREISLEEFQNGVKKLETVNTDWFDILYRTPFSQSHSLSFPGVMRTQLTGLLSGIGTNRIQRKVTSRRLTRVI